MKRWETIGIEHINSWNRSTNAHIYVWRKKTKLEGLHSGEVTKGALNTVVRVRETGDAKTLPEKWSSTLTQVFKALRFVLYTKTHTDREKRAAGRRPAASRALQRGKKNNNKNTQSEWYGNSDGGGSGRGSCAADRETREERVLSFSLSELRRAEDRAATWAAPSTCPTSRHTHSSWAAAGRNTRPPPASPRTAAPAWASGAASAWRPPCPHPRRKGCWCCRRPMPQTKCTPSSSGSSTDAAAPTLSRRRPTPAKSEQILFLRI